MKFWLDINFCYTKVIQTLQGTHVTENQGFKMHENDIYFLDYVASKEGFLAFMRQH
jgi:hypothetical protein